MEEVPSPRRSVSDQVVSYQNEVAGPGEPGDSKFVRSLAMVLWTKDKLANRSVTGKACVNKEDAIAHKACTPYKLQLLRNLLEKRITNEGAPVQEKEKRMKKFNQLLSAKIKQIRPKVMPTAVAKVLFREDASSAKEVGESQIVPHLLEESSEKENSGEDKGSVSAEGTENGGSGESESGGSESGESESGDSESGDSESEGND